MKNIVYTSLKGKLIPNPKHQLAFHTFMSIFWLVAMVFVPFLSTFRNWHDSTILAALLIMEVSLYANFATEFGAVSSSQAAVNTEVTIEKADTVNIQE
jgi:hypothetical protein